jgi:serine/threonine-protein kinase
MRWLKARGERSSPVQGGQEWLDGRHCLLKELGRGASAVVYEARGRDGQSYALKVPTDGGETLRREAAIACSLSSPHVLRCLGACQEGSSTYLKLELLPGETLAARLARRGRLKSAAIERLAGQMLDALEAVHGLGYVHRDLKPGNLFLSRERRKDTLKLMDFGLAAREGERHPAGCQGTAVYAAPEQWTDGVLDRRCDLYAFAVVVFEMATGLLPWSAGELSALLAMKRQAPAAAVARYRPDFWPGRDRLLQRLMRPEAAERPSTAAEVKGLWQAAG